MAFFMFRAGAHSDAVEFLEQYPEGHEVRSFSTLYRRYLMNPSPSEDEISEFQKEYDRRIHDVSRVKDMYREALVNLMTGNGHELTNERAFWEILVPTELETQLWYKLKLASLEKSTAKRSPYMPLSSPKNYKEYKLKDLHVYIESIGREYFVSAGPDGQSLPADIMSYFRALMIIG